MTYLTVGKIRGLREISTQDGLMTILALDHRGSLARTMGINSGAYRIMRDFKLMILEWMAGHTSAVLLDPEYSAAEAVARGVLPGAKGFIVALEESGYHGEPTARLNRVLTDWSVAKVKRMGASAAKLLLNYNPFAGEAAEQQERLVASLVEEARAADLLLMVEPVCYSLDPDVHKESPEFAVERPAIVTEIVRRIGALGADVLKIEFPHDARFNDDQVAWADACAVLSEASPVPWALLSAGVDYETFKRQVRVACQAGASGYVAGRAIWKEAVGLSGEERDTFLRTTGVKRLVELAELAQAYGRPWTAYYPDLAATVKEGWLTRYESA